MKHPLRTLALSLALFTMVCGFAVAEEAPQPTPEHEELAQWVGTWKGSGEMKPGPFGAGGPMTWTEECDWFAGARFNVVCKSKGKGPMGPMEGLGVVGYNSEKGVFTHYGVDNTGWSGYAEGTRSGKTWTFTSKETMQGQTFETRFTLTLETPKKMTFSWEMSEDGESWTVLMDGSTQKK